jgi:hypothetical protein
MTIDKKRNHMNLRMSGIGLLLRSKSGLAPVMLFRITRRRDMRRRTSLERVAPSLKAGGSEDAKIGALRRSRLRYSIHGLAGVSISLRRTTHSGVR